MAIQSSFKNMTLCLSVVCLVCSGVLSGVYALTAEPIKAANEAILANSIKEVLPEGVEISESLPIEVGGKASEYYVASRDGQIVGYAVKSETIGFGGKLEIMVGVLPGGIIYNTKVISHNETPGLGAKCDSDEKFMGQWKNLQVNPAEELKVSKDGGVIDAITASTITSKAYTKAVDNAVKAIAGVPMLLGSEPETLETVEE